MREHVEQSFSFHLLHTSKHYCPEILLISFNNVEYHWKLDSLWGWFLFTKESESHPWLYQCCGLVTYDCTATVFFLHSKVRREGCYYYAITESVVSIGWKFSKMEFLSSSHFEDEKHLCVLCHVWSYMAASWPEVLLPCHSLPWSDLAVLSVPISGNINVEH